MKILLLGKNGQLGWESQRVFSTLGEMVTLDYPTVDFTRPRELYQQVLSYKPQVILNTAAYTAVDKAETDVETARAVNTTAVGALAEAALHTGAALVHFSTDYVFDGTKGSAYTEEDAPNPLSVYGETKLDGEQALQQVGGAYLILRTSWVYSNRRDSFVMKVLQWASNSATLRIVSDQVSGPTWARSLAEISGQLLAKAGDDPAGWLKERSGVYHLAGSGYASRLEWAKEILKYGDEHQQAVEVLPALTADFPTPASRPLYSALDCAKFTRTFGLQLPDWRDALCLAMEK